MTFKTHNDTTIDINGTSLQGEVTATYAELCDLFGGHHDGDGYKVDAEWYVQFDDGTIATIYNWKNGKNYEGENGLPLEQIRDWHIGGTSPQAETLVQIALDLHREAKQKRDPVADAFSSAFDIMRSIREVHGEAYADAVGMALLIRKRAELFHSILSAATNPDPDATIPKDAAQALLDIDAHISAQIVGHIARAAKVPSTKEASEALFAWTDKIMECEQAGAKSLFGGLMKDKGK